MSRKLVFPASNRNAEPILKVLKTVLNQKFKSKVNVLEIASGSGQHAAYFTTNLKDHQIQWQPTDIDDQCLSSINAYIEEHKLTCVKTPLFIDISINVLKWKVDFDEWLNSYQMMLAVNLVHISPWICSVGLFKAAGELLVPGGILVTYGPYSVNGEIKPDSNIAFDTGLKSQNPDWGLRDIADLEVEAKKNGLSLENMFDMPSNNKTLIWTKK